MSAFVDKIAKLESDFREGKGWWPPSYPKYTLSGPTVLTAGGCSVEVIDCRRADGTKTYEGEGTNPPEKDAIVLHFTEDNIPGDIGWLMKSNPEKFPDKTWNWKWSSTAFVLARDGTIYRLYNEDYWSHNASASTFNPRTVGIELCNWGWLAKKGENLITQRGNNVYCSANETELYVQTAPWRGQTYWASFTDAQYEKLKALLKYLCAKFNIPYAFLPADGAVADAPRYKVSGPGQKWKYRGIVSHANYAAGKTDIGPGFDWSRLTGEETTAEPEDDGDHGTPQHFSLASMTEDQRWAHLKAVWKRAQERFGHEGDAAYDFQEENGKVNLIGARGLLTSTLEPVANTRDAWDDTMFVVFKDKEGKPRVRTFVISTEPNDNSAKGRTHCSTLKVGMHKYVLGVHSWGKPRARLKGLASYPQGRGYRALKPHGAVTTYIDANRNLTEDPGDNNINDPAINIHYGGDAATSSWSWGCQVFKGWSNYVDFIRLVESDASIKGTSDNDLADKPASDGTRAVIYLLVEGTYLRPAGMGFPVYGMGAKEHYELNEKGDGGYFPIGANNFWHGGAHFDTEAPVVAVADGEVVAYRATQAPLDVELGGQKMPLSNNFVLVRHHRETPKGQSIDFYSLYMHLLPLGAYSDEQKKAAPSPFKKRAFVVEGQNDGKGLNVRDGATGKTVLGVIPKDAHFDVVPNSVAKWNASFKEISYEGLSGFACVTSKYAEKVSGNTYRCTTIEDKPADASKLGLAVYETGSGSRMLRILPKGSELKFKLPNEVAPSGKIAVRWHQLEDGGWVYLRAGDKPSLGYSYTIEPEALDKVVETNLPITAGSIVGHTGPYLVRERTLHFEIITGDVKFMDNPKGDEGGSSILEVPAGTIFKKRAKPEGDTVQVDLPAGTRLSLLGRKGSYRKVVVEEVVGWAKYGALLDWSNSANCYVLRAPLATLYAQPPATGPVTVNAPKGTHVQFVSKAGDNRQVRCPVPADSAKTGWATAAELGEWNKKDDCFILQAPLARLYKEPPPEGFEFKEDAGKNEAPLYPEAPAGGSPSVSWDVDGHAWYEIEFAPGEKGWLNPDQPGVEKKCIYDWPTWQKVEEGGWHDDDGLCDAAEIVSLVDADGDGALTSAELKKALEDPVVAGKLRKIACVHPTEWAGELKGLKRLAGPPWNLDKKSSDATKDYIKKLGFWQDVKKAKLPAKDEVWNLHPIGFLEHLYALNKTNSASASCSALKVSIWKTWKEQPRSLSNANVVQVVAESLLKNAKTTVDLGVAHKVLKDWKKLGWSKFADKYRKSKPDGSENKLEFGFSKAAGTLGLNAAIESTVGCQNGGGHTLVLTTPDGEEKKLNPLGDQLEVAFDGDDSSVDSVVPKRYQLAGTTCDGAGAAATIEVYPASFVLFEYKFEQERKFWDKVMKVVNFVAEKAGGEIKLKFSGGFAGFFGWREDDDSWRAYYAYELAGKGGIEISYEQKLSLWLLTPVPQSLAKYAFDIGALIEVKGSIGVEAKAEIRDYPAGATDPGWDTVLSVELKLKIEFAFGLYAKLGNEKIISVQLTGKVKFGLSGGGRAQYKSKKLSLIPFATREPVEASVTLTLKSWITEHEKEWKWEWFPKKDLLKDDKGKDKYEFVIYDWSKKAMK